MTCDKIKSKRRKIKVLSLFVYIDRCCVSYEKYSVVPVFIIITAFGVQFCI